MNDLLNSLKSNFPFYIIIDNFRSWFISLKLCLLFLYMILANYNDENKYEIYNELLKKNFIVLYIVVK